MTEADPESVAAILEALKEKNYIIIGIADRYVRDLWSMNAAIFRSVLMAHFEAGYRIFVKAISDPPPGQEIFDGNFCLDPDSKDEDKDVYVEIRLKNRTAVIIVDAHNHRPGRRLPK